MLFPDPLSSSSLFLEPLSPLPDFQFAPANFQKPSTNTPNSMAASSVAVATPRREIMGSLSAVPFAEKPSLTDNETEKDGRRRLGKTEKGRRHAGEAVLRRKLANHAFLVRVEGVGKESGEGRPAGGRGRGRALSERVAAEFAPSVPYSLNRRSRWAKLNGGEWLADLANRGGALRGDRLRLLLAEADYSLDGSESIRALHSLDAEKGLLHSRWGKSGRGASSIGHLSSADGQSQQQENRDPRWDDAVEDVLFHLQRPHPVAKVFAAKFFKRSKTFRSAKRSAVESALGAKASGGQPPQQQTEGPRRKAVAVPESEPEEENEFVAQYRCVFCLDAIVTTSVSRPRQETYSLADFVKETCTPPVMVRRQPKGSEAQLAEEFAIVPMPECVPLPSRCSSADSPADSSPPFVPCDPLQNRLSSASRGAFLRFPFPADLSLLNRLRISKSEWSPIWLCEGTLMFDLSCQLSSKMETPLAVMILDGTELIVNTVFPLEGMNELAHPSVGLEMNTDKLDELFKVIGLDYAQWSAKSESSRAQLSSSDLDAHRSVFHSTRLAQSAQPTTVYDILAEQRAQWATEEGQFVRAEELMKPNSEEQTQQQNGGAAERSDAAEEGDDEFELIEMAELGADEEQKGPAGADPDELVSQCADCSRCPVPRLTMLRSCGHRICRECIARSVEEQTKADQTAEIRCPVCAVSVPLDLLPLFLPLPVANSFALLHFVRNSPHSLAQCLGCFGLLQFSDRPSIHSVKMSRHILCARCSLLWCVDCNSLPHWPLNCALNVQWSQKFAQHERCQKEFPLAKGGTIAAQFSQICSEAHARRMDLKLGCQLGKQTRRLLGDAKAERRFVGARKMALHLLEFGTAWLYLCRQNPRPPAWSQLRSLLWALRDLTDSLDNELLFSASLSEVRGLKERIEQLEGMVDKTQQTFADEAK